MKWIRLAMHSIHSCRKIEKTTGTGFCYSLPVEMGSRQCVLVFVAVANCRIRWSVFQDQKLVKIER